MLKVNTKTGNASLPNYCKVQLLLQVLIVAIEAAHP